MGWSRRAVGRARGVVWNVRDWWLRRGGLYRVPGERQYPSWPGTLYAIDPDHLYRYEQALPYCAGKSVLDFGCGVGYGSYVLSRVSAEVVGYDVSDDALKWARFYAAKSPNLTYAACLPEREFDFITCFECIEHVPDPRGTLNWLADHCLGHLMVSTPEAKEDKWSAFHTVEFTRDEFLEALAERFEVEETQTQHTNGCQVIIALCRRLDSAP